jgi:hypothetical protein
MRGKKSKNKAICASAFTTHIPKYKPFLKEKSIPKYKLHYKLQDTYYIEIRTYTLNLRKVRYIKTRFRTEYNAKHKLLKLSKQEIARIYI